MREPHVYLTNGFVVEGTPISQDEFEELAQTKSSKRHDDVVYLKDVTILSHNGKVADVALFMLERSSTPGVGRSSIKVPEVVLGR